MGVRRIIICSVFMLGMCSSSFLFAQEKKLEKLRVGGGSASATQMSLWLAKEGNYYEKHGLNVEVISIPGSSLAIQAMLSGELPIIQAGGAGPIQANLSGTDTVIIATIAKKFNWWIFSQPNINRMEDLKGKVFGTTRFGTQSDLASRIALRRHGLDPERDITMVQTGRAGGNGERDDDRQGSRGCDYSSGDVAGQEGQAERAVRSLEARHRVSCQRGGDDPQVHKVQ